MHIKTLLNKSLFIGNVMDLRLVNFNLIDNHCSFCFRFNQLGVLLFFVILIIIFNKKKNYDYIVNNYKSKLKY